MRFLRLTACTNVSFSLAFVAVLLWSSCTFASENTAAKSATAVQAGKSELFESCKDAVNSPTFEVSYCADVLRNALIGFGTITSSIPPTKWQTCDAEMKAQERSVKWLLYLPDSVTLLTVAKKYVDLKNEQFPLKLINSPFLITKAEQEIASVLAAYKSKSVKALNKHFENEFEKRLPSKSPYWLYKSCEIAKLAKNEDAFTGSYCEAVISGIWIGYALAYYQLPEVANDKECGNRRSRELNGLKERFNGSFACISSKRRSNVTTAMSYLNALDKRSTPQILRLADEPPSLEVSRQISKLCNRN